MRCSRTADYGAALLRVVAAYASGGMKALNELSVRRNAGTIKLLEQMR